MLPVFILSIEEDGKREFMTELYLRFYSPMLKRAMAIVCDENCAEEIVQETFLQLIKNADLVMNIDRPKIPYYLMAAVRNTAVSSLRKLKRSGMQISFSFDENSAAEKIADPAPQPEEVYLHAELCSEVAKSIAQLSDRDRLFTVPLSLHCFATGAVTIRGMVFSKNQIFWFKFFKKVKF